jgi:hypothetical protein
LFVTGLLLLREGVKRIGRILPEAASHVPNYGLGVVAAFWLMERLAVVCNAA